MAITNQKPALIDATDTYLRGFAMTLVTRLPGGAAQLADVYGTCTAHAAEWQHAAPLEPHSEAYVPAWVYLSMIIWADKLIGHTGRGDGFDGEEDAGWDTWPWSHGPV